MKIAILVTHLLGSGHLARAGKIADAFVEAGHDVLLLSGGMPAPHAAPKRADLLQLPPVRADGPAFRAMLDGGGQQVTEAFLGQRRAVACDALAGFGADVLLTELFPFGRRKLAAEFIAAVETVRAVRRGALVYASIRDILQQPRKAGRKEEAEARFEALYDGALLHGASGFLPLDRSWTLPKALNERVFDTGYIGAAHKTPDGIDGTGEIVVSAGGGSVGDALFRASLDAAKGSAHRWRLLVGGHDREARIAAFSGDPNVVVEAIRPDFRDLLARCSCAVVQCGYNTAMDVVATGARAVFCPFEGEGEAEQLTRATAMRANFGCGMIREAALDGPTLSHAVSATMAGPKPDYSSIRLDGARRSVEIIERHWRECI